MERCGPNNSRAKMRFHTTYLDSVRTMVLMHVVKSKVGKTAMTKRNN